MECTIKDLPLSSPCLCMWELAASKTLKGKCWGKWKWDTLSYVMNALLHQQKLNKKWSNKQLLSRKPIIIKSYLGSNETMLDLHRHLHWQTNFSTLIWPHWELLLVMQAHQSFKLNRGPYLFDIYIASMQTRAEKLLPWRALRAEGLSDPKQSAKWQQFLKPKARRKLAYTACHSSQN